MFGCPHLFGCIPCMFGCPHYVWILPCMFGHPYVWMPPYVWKMFGCLLYIYNTNKTCFVRLRGVHMLPIHLDAPICLCTPNMFRCPSYIWMHPLYVWMPPYVWIFPCMFGHPYVWMSPEYVWTLPYVWLPPICFEDVWMPAAHIQHKESMLCQTEEVSICPPYFWMPHMFRCTCMFGHPPYVWMSLIPLVATIHLAVSKHTVGQPNI